MKQKPPAPARSRAVGTPSPCCGQPLAADMMTDRFFCPKCSKSYSLDEVLDLVLDTAAKPASNSGPTSIGIDDDDDLLDHLKMPKFGSGSSGSRTVPPRPKMVPLSRTLNTYAVKEELKAQCGAKWDHINKQWLVPDDKFALAQQIVTRGPAKAPPKPNVPFTASKFAGIDLDDVTFDEFNKMSWAEHEALMHERAVRAAQSQTVRLEVRVCWECGKESSEGDVKLRGGEWESFWCGCNGK